MDILIRNARLMDGTLVQIGIDRGRIVEIGTAATSSATTEIDAEQRLVIPAFVNGQLHACKSFWRRALSTLPMAVQKLPRFEAAQYVKRMYSEEDVFARVDEVMRLALLNGTCAIRLFGDVDEAAGLTALRGLLRIKERYQPWMTVQVVAFPQDGVLGGQTRQLMEEALRLGADVVGGIPWIESDRATQQAHVDLCFQLAETYNRDLHFICDDAISPRLRTLEMVARRTIASAWQGRVAATQCAALAAYDDTYAALVIDLLCQAEMTIFSNSHVSLIATEVAGSPLPRGITRVRQLLAAGVPVACGQDDIDNWFYPFGRNDMLEVAQFMAHNGQFAWQGEVDHVLPMVTNIPARLMRVQNYGLAVGNEANVLILDAPDWHHALQFQVDKRCVILRGTVVAQTTRRQEIIPSLRSLSHASSLPVDRA